MKYATLALMGVLATAGLAVAHDGDADKRDIVTDYDFNGFDRIKVSGVHTLDVRMGDTFSVRTEATKEGAEWSEVRLDGKTLILGKDDNRRNWNQNGRSHNGSVLAIVTLPRLSDLDVSGVTSGTVSAFTGGDITIDVSGVTNLTLSGACDDLNIDLSGVADIKAEDLRCSDVDADVSGVSKLEVYASDKIEADSSGMSQVSIYGDPSQRNIDQSKMAKVKFR